MTQAARRFARARLGVPGFWPPCLWAAPGARLSPPVPPLSQAQPQSTPGRRPAEQRPALAGGAAYSFNPAFSHFISLKRRSSLRTVIVEPDRKRFILVWQSVLECHSKIENLDETVVKLKRRV